MSIHTTNDQAGDAMLGRFRVALHTVEQSPSDEAVGELRSAAAPILDKLRAEYWGTGHTDGDRTALFRWLRATLANPDFAVKPAAPREDVI
jgi:hypothetical protein